MKRLLPLVVVGAITFLVGLPGMAFASSSDPTAGCSGTWASANAAQDVLTIDCRPGFASNDDRILIYPRQPSAHPTDWRQALNMSDAVWLFEVGATNKVSLMIDFHRNSSGPGVVADLYDDQSGQKQVAYRLVQGIPAPLDQPPLPTIHVVAPDGWWVKDGLINYNLDISVDGPVLTGWSSDAFVPLLHRDGAADFTITVRDANNDGRPDWEFIRAFPPLPSSSAIPRSVLMVSPDGDLPISHYVFWPLLSAAPWGLVQPYGDRLPPIQVAWQDARITTIGELVASRGAPGNWFTYSLSPFDVGTTGYADFENPFAFYNLAQKNDGYPDLAIRHVYEAPGDAFSDIGTTDQPFDVVRYSWDQQHAHAWDYKLDLLGRNRIDTRVSLGPLILDTIPYDALPSWVLSHPWDIATFVADEGGGSWTSEGMYDSPLPDQDTLERYIMGQDQRPLNAANWNISVGFRTDYLVQPGIKPRLYISAIDHKVHLLGAQAGVWNIGASELRYSNLGGPYLNRWETQRVGLVQDALDFIDGQLIHETQTGVSLRAVDVPPALFTAQPPSDHQSWEILGQELAAHQAPFPGTDLDAMFNQFHGPVQTLAGAHMRNLQLTPDGFAFTIELTTASTADGPWLRLPSGVYSARFQVGHGYTVSPLTPPALTFSSFSVLGDHPAPLVPVQLALLVTNTGADDAPNVTLTFTATQGRRPTVDIGSVSVNVPGNGGTKTASVSWAPPSPGPWTIHATATNGSGSHTAVQKVLQVAPAPPADLANLQAAEKLGGGISGPLTALLGLALTGGLVAAGVYWPSARDRAGSPGD